MLRAEELRIGNLLGTPDGVEEVITIQSNSIFYTENYKNSWAEIKPIPLTEEWLVKFGFEKVSCGDDEFGYSTDYDLIGKDFFLSYADDFSISIAESKKTYENTPNCLTPDGHLFKYVHQLQNLYFALTGEELTLKQ